MLVKSHSFSVLFKPPGLSEVELFVFKGEMPAMPLSLLDKFTAFRSVVKPAHLLSKLSCRFCCG